MDSDQDFYQLTMRRNRDVARPDSVAPGAQLRPEASPNAVVQVPVYSNFIQMQGTMFQGNMGVPYMPGFLYFAPQWPMPYNVSYMHMMPYMQYPHASPMQVWGPNSQAPIYAVPTTPAILQNEHPAQQNPPPIPARRNVGQATGTGSIAQPVSDALPPYPSPLQQPPPIPPRSRVRQAPGTTARPVVSPIPRVTSAPQTFSITQKVSYTTPCGGITLDYTRGIPLSPEERWKNYWRGDRLHRHIKMEELLERR